jgi:hypothetical protein
MSIDKRFSVESISTVSDAINYYISRSKQLLKHGYFLTSFDTFHGGVSAYFEKNRETFQSIYIFDSFRGKGLFKNQVRGTILTDYDCGLYGYLNKNNIDFKIVSLIPYEEYRMISSFYGDKKAERSGVYYMNHIDEGLYILDKINASMIAKKAYCLHPIIQTDEDIIQESIYNRLTDTSPKVAMVATEYRSVANEYLSNRVIKSINEIRLSPLKDVNDMLIADKIQNRKDFIFYHQDAHPRSKELSIYFDNWFRRLGITRDFYNECVEVIGKF